MTGETEREGNGAREQRLLVHFSKCGGGSETPKTERVIVSAKSSNDLLRNGTVTNWKLFCTARGNGCIAFVLQMGLISVLTILFNVS